MRGDLFEHFGNPAALQTVPADLLLRLFEPWPGVLAGGVAVHGAVLDLVAGGRVSLAPDLADALERIEDLATDDGFDAILARLHGTGDTVDWGALGLSPFCLAVRTWVDHPALFAQAEVKLLSRRVARMREYSANDGHDPSMPEADALDAAQEALRMFWRGKGRGDFCRLGAFEEGGRIFLPIHRGRPLRTVTVIDGRAEGSLAYRPRATDLAIYDPRTRRLLIKASDPKSRAEYGRQIGRLLGTRFDERPVVTLEPLVRRGLAALQPTPGLRDVQVTELHLRVATKPPLTVMLKGADVLRSLAGGSLHRFGESVPVCARLRLTPRKGHARAVLLTPPADVGYQRRGIAPLIRRFLEERGFVAPPDSGELPSAASAPTRQIGLFG